MIRVAVRESVRARMGVVETEPSGLSTRRARTRVLGVKPAELFPLAMLFLFVASWIVFWGCH